MHYGIIAAGQGSRLRQEGVEVPKPLVRLNGVPMIERLISIFEGCGAESINVIINPYMGAVRDCLKSLQCAVPLRVVEADTPSSMHSFYELSRNIGFTHKFILTTVDTIFMPDEFCAYAHRFQHCSSDISALMGVTPFVDDEKPLYVSADSEMRITEFTDRETEQTNFVSGGIYGLTPTAVQVLERCISSGISRMRNFQRSLLSAGLEVKAFPFEKIIDVDHADDILKAESMLAGADLNNPPQCLI